MAKVVFTYFDLKALGEGIRLLMTYGGQEFEDVRIPEDELEWSKYKPLTPFGQLPVLKIGDKEYAQSVAISRYFGRKYGLAGATLEDDLEIDQNVDFINDIRIEAAAVRYEEDPVIMNKKFEEHSKNSYPVQLSKLSEIIEKNNGHIALGKLTWADFVFAGVYDYMKWLMQDPKLEEKYPSFKKVVDNVHSLPQLQEYLAKAPRTEY